jgi:hypothetical protein
MKTGGTCLHRNSAMGDKGRLGQRNNENLGFLCAG